MPGRLASVVFTPQLARRTRPCQIYSLVILLWEGRYAPRPDIHFFRPVGGALCAATILKSVPPQPCAIQSGIPLWISAGPHPILRKGAPPLPGRIGFNIPNQPKQRLIFTDKMIVMINMTWKT